MGRTFIGTGKGQASNKAEQQHSATNGCFREVKNQRPLFGDELEEMSVAFRPDAAVQL